MENLAGPMIELHFPIRGDEIPADHAYGLYGALSRFAPEIHGADWLGIHTIKGRKTAQGRIRLSKFAKLRVRLPLLKVPSLCSLSGARLQINGTEIRCGIPEIHQLRSSSTLRSRLVIFNTKEAKEQSLTPEIFFGALTRRLTELNISAAPELESAPEGNHGPFARRVLKIKDTVLPGYGVILRDLSDDDSVLIQEMGLGAKRRMGCGLFLPLVRGD